MLKKDAVLEYIRELNEEIRSRRIANSTEYQERLTQIIRGELQEEVIAIVQDEQGKSKATIIKAIEVLSKIQLTTVENNNEVVKFINEENIQK